MIATMITVVVPTRGRPALLLRCLEALCAQDFGPHDYDVLVVDDGARLGLPVKAVVAGLRARRAAQGAVGPALGYIATKTGRGPAAARNLGWRHARAPVIAFTDDDTVPAPRWLREAWKVLNEGYDAVTGKVEMPLPPCPTDYERNAAGLGAAEFVTANCLVRRDALVAVGGFDERFALPWREDSDLQFALLRSGRRIGHAPAAVVVHPLRPARWGASIGQQRNVLYDALLYKKHPRLYRERIRPRPPWHYHAAVAALLCAAGAALGGAPAMFGAALAVWLAITAWFTAARLRGNSLRPAHVLEMIVTSMLIPPLSLYWRLRGALRFRVLFT